MNENMNEWKQKVNKRDCCKVGREPYRQNQQGTGMHLITIIGQCPRVTRGETDSKV